MASRLATVEAPNTRGGSVRPRHPRQVALERLASHLFRRAEAAFAVTGLFLFSSALVPLLVEQSGVDIEAYSGNPVLRLTYTLVHAVTLGLVAVHWRAVTRTARRNLPTIALVALSLVSVAWSADVPLSGRRALAFFGTTAFGVWLAARYDVRALLKLLGAALGIAALLSAVFALALPSYGLDHGPHAGNWRGVFMQKNTLAQAMVLGTIVFLLYEPGSRLGRWVRRGGIVLSVALILLSTSKTALGVLVTLVAVMGMYRTLRWRATLAVPVVTGAMVAAGAAGVWLLANSETLLTAAGKDPTLTGRTPIWLAVIDMIGQRPWFGYGYSGFWLGYRYPSQLIYERLQWSIPHAHNGFLDLALQVGLVGLALFVLAVAIAARRSVAAVRANPSRDALWPLVMLTFILLYNVTETTVLQSNTLYWVLFAAAVFAPMAAEARRDDEDGPARTAPGIPS